MLCAQGVQHAKDGLASEHKCMAALCAHHTCVVMSCAQGLQHAKDELVNEHEYITAQGDPYNDSIHLRVMLDVLR